MPWATPLTVVIPYGRRWINPDFCGAHQQRIVALLEILRIDERQSCIGLDENFIAGRLHDCSGAFCIRQHGWHPRG